jgi:type I restriction enzyme, S subunit
VNIVRTLPRPTTVNSSIAVITPNARLAGVFLYYLFESSYMEHTIQRIKGGMGVPHLFQADLNKFYLPLPSQNEQTKIASFLDRETSKIDELVGEQRRLIELLKEKRQAVISHAVTKGLNPHAPLKPSGIEWLGDVPEHWRMKRLKRISPAVTVGIVVNPSTYACDEGLPFIHGGDIREGIINASDARKISPKDSAQNSKTMLECGDVITVRVGAGRGTTAVVPPECSGGNCASVMLIRRGEYDSNWLCYAMNDRLIQFQIEMVEYGAAQPQFNISHAIEFWIPVPPHDEQIEIAERLKGETAKLDALTAEAERGIELLQERRTALISAAVTGQIDVRDYSRGVAGNAENIQ